MSYNLINGPFSDGGNKDPGIYLHWTLPDAINHMVSDEETEEAPHLPDRWLITRLHFDESEKITTKSWIVESNYLIDPYKQKDQEDQEDKKEQKEYTGTSIPFKPYEQPDSTPFRYLGKVFDFDDWQPDRGGDYLDHLSPIGFGQLHFSAFYQNCESVFGFNDEAPPEGTLYYSVIGWYGNEAQDFANAKDQVREHILAPLLAQLKEKRKIGEDTTFDTSLFHGLVYDIEWKKDKKYLSNAPIEEVKISVGNSHEEAFACLEANENVVVEKLLHLLQHDMTDHLDDTSIDNINEQLNDLGFTLKKGGVNWMFEDEETDIDVDLTTLNQTQKEIEQFKREFDYFKWSIFSDWFRYMFLTYEKDSDDKPYKKPFQFPLDSKCQNEIEKYIKKSDPLNADNYEKFDHSLKNFKAKIKKSLFKKHGEKKEKEKIVASIGNLEASLEDLLNKASRQIPENSKSKIKTIPKANFLEPSDLVVLLNFSKESVLHAGGRNQGENKIVLPRLESDIISVSMEVPTIRQPGNWNQWDWKIINKLLNEAVYCAKSSHLNNDTEHWPEPLCLTQHTKNPWLPLLLDWEVEYYTRGEGNKQNFEPTFFTDNYCFDNNNILRDQNNEWNSYEKGNITGRCMLSDFVERNAKDNLDYNGQISEDGTHDLKSKNYYLSQQLDGFTAGLMMKRKALEFKIVDPKNNSDETDLVSSFSENSNLNSPIPSFTYSPIRNGIFRISRLRIIDVFGQHKEIKIGGANKITYATSLSRNGLFDAYFNDAEFQLNQFGGLLSPRICQPSRFNFDFVDSGKTERKGTPIFGWLIPNFIQNALMIFDAKGELIGNIQEGHKAGKLDLLRNVNGLSSDVAIVQEVQEVINFFINKDTSLLDRFDQLHSDALQKMIPNGQHSGFQFKHLVGRPIAICKIQLGIELMGLPTPDLSWDALQVNSFIYDKTKDIELPINRNFSEIEVPVKIGSILTKQDGFIGFFRKEEAYQTFHTAFVPEEEDVLFSSDCQIQVPLSFPHGKIMPASDRFLSDEYTREVLALIDPELHVEGASGVLPKKKIHLPQAAVIEAFHNFKYTFEVNAVLTEKEEIGIPTPDFEHMKWNWTEKKAKEIWDEPMTVSLPGGLLSDTLILREGWLTLSEKEEENKTNADTATDS